MGINQSEFMSVNIEILKYCFIAILCHMNLIKKGIVRLRYKSLSGFIFAKKQINYIKT